MIVCDKCNKYFKSKAGLIQHIRFCNGNNNLQAKDYYCEEGYKCPYCGRIFNKYGICSHINSHTSNKNSGRKGHVAWNKGLTKETDLRVRNNGIAVGKSLKGKAGIPLSREVRRKLSDIALEKSKNGEWHTSLAKNMHYNYKGIDLHGRWELGYAKFLDSNKILWRRPAERFEYQFQDSTHYYTPDFYLIEENCYVEIKGYKTMKDEAKWKQFPLKLKIMMEKDLRKIIKI